MSLDIENDTISYKKEEKEKESIFRTTGIIFIVFLITIVFLILSPLLAIIDLYNYVRFRRINRIKENEKIRRIKENRKSNFTLQKRKKLYLYLSIALTGNLFIINYTIIFGQHILLSLLINNLLFF